MCLVWSIVVQYPDNHLVYTRSMCLRVLGRRLIFLPVRFLYLTSLKIHTSLCTCCPSPTVYVAWIKIINFSLLGYFYVISDFEALSPVSSGWDQWWSRGRTPVGPRCSRSVLQTIQAIWKYKVLPVLQINSYWGPSCLRRTCICCHTNRWVGLNPKTDGQKKNKTKLLNYHLNVIILLKKSAL